MIGGTDDMVDTGGMKSIFFFFNSISQALILLIRRRRMHALSEFGFVRVWNTRSRARLKARFTLAYAKRQLNIERAKPLRMELGGLELTLPPAPG